MSTRIGDVQSYVLLMIAKGVNDFSELVDNLRSFAIPKSSIYTAVEELSKKGLIVKVQDGARLRLALTDKGREALQIVAKMLARRMAELKLLLSLLEIPAEDCLSELDPETLEKLRESLYSVLQSIEKALERWRRINVE